MSDSARLSIFCGKGGVGKTTLSLAAGLKQALEGRKVLVITSHPLGELALAVSLEGFPSRFPGAAANLFVVHIDPRELIRDFVREHFPAALMGQRIVNSSMFKGVIEIAPGLKELFFLGRLQELSERSRADSAGGAPEYDCLVWDAPATGHFLSTLQSAKGFEVYLTGPLAKAGAQLHRFFANAANIRLLAVTSLEEMAMAETLELARAMEKDFQIPCSALVVNCASPLCSAAPADIERLARAADGSEALRFALKRGQIERERCKDLRAALSVPQVLIPRITEWANDLDLIAKIGAAMDSLQA